MSYLVLSLKYRPQTFEEIVGQAHITKTLTNAFKKGRVAQAYLFTGPRGVGKTTTARLVAKAMNCLETPGNPCNKCSNCIEIADGRNMDVLEIDGASNRGIEEIRSLREVIQYAPINSKNKVFIIDEVHMLTTQAFNALLKTLEEPPPHGKFILATTDIYKVPATIISRCQRFDFHSISAESINKQIQFVLKQEKIEIDNESLKTIARKADGSMRDGLSILDQVIAYAGENITIDEVNKVLGLVPNELYFDIIDSLQSKNAGELIKLLSEVKSTGMPVGEFTSGLNRHIRNMMLATVNNGLDALELNPDLKEKYIVSAKSWNIRELLRLAQAFTELEAQVKRATQPHILIELALLKLLELDSLVTIETLMEQLKKPSVYSKPQPKEQKSAVPEKQQAKPVIEKVTEPKPLEPPVESNVTVAQVSEPIPEIPKKEATVTVNVEDGWDDFLKEISDARPSIGNVLEHCEVKQAAGNRVEIKLVNGHSFNLRTLVKNKMVVEKYMEKVFGKPLRAVFLMTQSAAPKKDEKKEENTKKANDLGTEVMNMFDGEILT